MRVHILDHQPASLGLRLLLFLSLTLLLLPGCKTPPTKPEPEKPAEAPETDAEAKVAAAKTPPAPTKQPAEKSIDPELQAKIADNMRSLRSRDAGARRQAAGALLAIGNVRTIDTLLNMMENDSDAGVRITLIETFGQSQHPPAFQCLLRLLSDSDPDIRLAASEALGQYRGHSYVSRLLQILADDKTPTQTRKLLIHALEDARIFAGVSVLVDILDKGDPALKAPTVEALTRITRRNFGENVQVWKQWLELNKLKSREELLEDYVSELEEKIDSIQKDVELARAETRELLSLQIDQQAGKERPFSQLLASEYQSVREFAAVQMAGLSAEDAKLVFESDPKLPELMSATKPDASDTVRLSYVSVLFKVGTPKAVTMLRAYLADRSPQVRALAARNLGKLQDKASVRALGQLLESEEIEVRQAAAEGLGMIADEVAMKYLIRAADDVSEPVRWFAADGLRKVENPRVVPVLINLLHDTSPRVREGAASALGAYSYKESIRALTETLDDKDERVRRQAEVSLTNMVMSDLQSLKTVADLFVSRAMHKAIVQLLVRELPKLEKNGADQQEVLALKHTLADAYMAQEDSVGAVKTLQDIVRTGPDDETAKQKLASVWLKMEAYQQLAEAVSDWMLSPNADTKRYWFNYALDLLGTLINQKRMEEAGRLIGALDREKGSVISITLNEKFASLKARFTKLDQKEAPGTEAEKPAERLPDTPPEEVQPE